MDPTCGDRSRSLIPALSQHGTYVRVSAANLFPGCSEPQASLFRPCSWHPFAQTLGGVFSALRSCSRSAADLLLPLLPVDVEILAPLACVRSPDRLLSISLLSGATPARTDVGTHHQSFLRDDALSHQATSLSLSSFHIPHPPTQRRLTVRNAWSSDLHAPHRNLLATEGPHRARPKLCRERRGQSA